MHLVKQCGIKPTAKNDKEALGAGVLHLRELRALCCVVCLERQRGCGKIGLSLRPLFPPLDATCPARALQQHVIVIGGRFATQELLVLDLDIMVRLDVNMKE